MDRLNSQFSIAHDDLEIRFTYFYFLGYSLGCDGAVDGRTCDAFIPRTDWRESEEAGYFSNKFIDKMELEHFHLDPEKIFDGETIFDVEREDTVREEDKPHKFSFFDEPYGLESIGAIECSILRSGYLALTIRIVNKSEISSFEALNLIKNLESVSRKNISEENRPGNLLVKLQEIVIKIEKLLPMLLNNKKITRYNFEKDEHLPLPDLSYDDERRSRPYLGILFRFSDTDYSKLDHLKTCIQRFVVSSARTTPAFLNSFSNPGEYLSSSNRNIYDPGKSIAYIARRGWCIFDAGDHARRTFRLGVVETTHFVIISILASARAWRKYIEDTETEAGKKFYILNKEINRLIKTGNNKAYKDALGAATQFMAVTSLLSPQVGLSRLIESHAKSHTARAAVRRCEDISNIKELENISETKMHSYSSILRTASNYYQAQASDYRKKGIRIAICAILISTLVTLVANIEKISSLLVKIHNLI